MTQRGEAAPEENVDLVTERTEFEPESTEQFSFLCDLGVSSVSSVSQSERPQRDSRFRDSERMVFIRADP